MRADTGSASFLGADLVQTAWLSPLSCCLSPRSITQAITKNQVLKIVSGLQNARMPFQANGPVLKAITKTPKRKESAHQRLK